LWSSIEIRIFGHLAKNKKARKEGKRGEKKKEKKPKLVKDIINYLFN